MEVQLLPGARLPAADAEWLRRAVAAAVAACRTRVARMTVRVVDDTEMARLHARHSGDATTTDVLAFGGMEQGEVSVDIAICADEAGRQAAARGIAVRDELLLYAVHGLLHAAGFDDGTESDAFAMHEEEARLMRAAGAAPARGAGGTA